MSQVITFKLPRILREPTLVSECSVYALIGLVTSLVFIFTEFTPMSHTISFSQLIEKFHFPAATILCVPLPYPFWGRQAIILFVLKEAVNYKFL